MSHPPNDYSTVSTGGPVTGDSHLAAKDSTAPSDLSTVPLQALWAYQRPDGSYSKTRLR